MEREINSKGKRLKNAVEKITVPLVSVILALFIGAIVINAIGVDPMNALYHLFRGSLGTKFAIGETIINMIPLIILGLSFAFARKCGMTNLGMEGQFHVGAVLSLISGVYFQGLPSFLHIPLSLIAGMFGGFVWGLIAGYLKTKFGASEVITTIMLNHIARNFANYLIVTPLCEPPGDIPQTCKIQSTAVLPRIVKGTSIHAGLFVALLCVVFVYVFLEKMKKGYEIKVVGSSREAARYAGMSVGSISLLAIAISGALSGLTGAVEVLGIQFRLSFGFGGGVGFSGIPVAMLADNSPFGIIISAGLFGILKSGSNAMQLSAGVPSAIVGIIQGLVVVFVLISKLYRIILTKISIKKRAKQSRGIELT